MKNGRSRPYWLDSCEDDTGKTPQMYEIAHSETFPFELGRVPKKVRSAYLKTVLSQLRSNPEVIDPPRVKKLDGFRALWRYRVAEDWRLIYGVDRKESLVTLLMIGHRGSVYERLGLDELGHPGIRIVATATELLETQPTDAQVGRAVMQLAEQNAPVAPSAAETALPMELSPELLSEWSVPVAYIQQLAGAKTDEQLLALSSVVPGNVMERVLNGLWPPPIEEVTQRPVRITASSEAMIEAAEGNRPLSGFLLKLDDVQKAYVARFQQSDARGPWLIKGGPGSGKSTVAVYCAQALLRGSPNLLQRASPPPKILYTTFTNALTNASRFLIGELGTLPEQSSIEVSTIDKLVRSTPTTISRLRIASAWSDWRDLLSSCVAKFSKSATGVGFQDDDLEFIHKEIDWVIFGQGLRTIEEYEAADRRGRGRAISSQQRRLIWQIHAEFRKALHAKGMAMASDLAAEASRSATPRFDYVFIDEAQDLKPVHIRFAVGLCRSPEGVFITADDNQSIYGNGVSWRSVAGELRFVGRARTLNRNYRTTSEIWQALSQLAPTSGHADPETLELASVFKGPWPHFVRYASERAARRRLNEFLFDALQEERVGAGCAAVLCTTNRQAEAIVQWIDGRLNPKLMLSRDVDLGHLGVKVMTIHASKGLQFPVVAVAGLEGPRSILGTSRLDQEEQLARDQRVLFVGCSRAMRRLMVLESKERPSPLTSRVSDEHWEIENV